MRRALVCVILLAAVAAAAVSVTAEGPVFERFLAADRPADRAIMAYLERERNGTASSRDLAELGVLLVGKGFPEDAEDYFEKALKLDKKNVDAAYRLGLVRQRMGKNLGAVRAYRKVIKMRPGYAPARFMLALVEERSGRRSRAIYDYAKAYKHMPELADPARNPLVLDSRLQAEAQLLRYRREIGANTLKVTPIDPDAVKLMMEVRPQPPAPPAAAPAAQAPVAKATPAPPAPAPTPRPAPRTVVAPTAAPVTVTPAGPPTVIRQAVPATAVPAPSPAPGGGPAFGAPRPTPTPKS
ncbi:MAG: tetratricopeptide repeat protein [Acidobacteria bacterium]|nr:tetratricopeptide repeat protein [Acidobacteriota bacterium]